MGQFNSSGIKVLDRAVAILTSVSREPRTLAELCDDTGLPRATAHRLATALETHRLLGRAGDGRWVPGPMLEQLATGRDELIDAAEPVMDQLKDATNESVQLYRLTGTTRTCVAAREPEAGLQNTVPVGTRMPLTAGSAARVFVAYSDEELRERVLPAAEFTEADLEEVRRRGWAESVSEREVGLASLSSPVFDTEGEPVAVISLSGVAERLKPSPGALWADEILDAAAELSRSLRR
ncbi:IclR family transcriptional regulator [Corynebacterium frankenforstense]